MATGIRANNRWVLVPDRRFSFANLSTSSSYTEASPRPGVPDPASSSSTYVLRLSGSQDVSATLGTSHAGLPGLANAARATWRKTTDAAALQRQWMPPSTITQAVVCDVSNTLASWDIVAIPDTGKLVFAWYESTTPALRVGIYDPATAAVTSSALTMPSGITADYPSLVRLPSGRLLMTVGERAMLVSDDNGTTWTAWARGITIATDTIPMHRRTVYDVATGALVSEGFDIAGSSSENERSVSYDLGQSWAQVTTATNNQTGIWLSLAATDVLHRWVTSGTVGINYTRTSNPAAAPSVSVNVDNSQVFVESAGWADPDGTLWCAGRTSGATGQIRLYRSVNNGTTWSRSLYDLSRSGAGFAIAGLRCVAAGGASWALGASTTTGLTLLRLGGWTSAATPLDAKSRTPAVADLDLGRVGIGGEAYSSGPTAGQFIALAATPAQQGWTAAGTATESLTTGGREIATTANTRTFTLTPAGTETRWLFAFEMYFPTPGGSRTGDDVAVAAYANGYGVSIRLAHDGFAVRDFYGATDRANVTVSLATPMQFIVELVPGAVSVLFRRPYETAWTEATDAATVTQSGTSRSFGWGHAASTTSTSRWTFVSVAGFSSSDYTNVLRWPGASTTARALTIGRCLTSEPTALGLLTTAGEQLFAEALDGPAALDESFVAAPIADYSARHLFWDISPSPRQTWRSTSTAEQTFQWDFTDATRINGLSHIGLVVSNSNFTGAVYLEAWTGSAWTTLATYTPAIDGSLIWSRSGDRVTIVAGGDRVFAQSEFVGGTVLLASGKYRKIVQQNAGLATSGGAQPTLRISGVDNTEGTSGTTGDLYAHSGVVVAVNKLTSYTKFRVRIPSMTTADGYFEAGCIAVCSAHCLGLEFDWGWQWTSEPTVERQTMRDGSQRNRQTGPNVRSLTIAWPEGVDQRNYRTGLDLYVDVYNNGSWSVQNISGSSLAEYPAVYGDVPWLLSGLLDDLEGGAIPCAIVNSKQGDSWSGFYADTYAGSTTTDTTTWLWGHIQGPVTVEQVLGDDVSGEVYRVQQVTIREAT